MLAGSFGALGGAALGVAGSAMADRSNPPPPAPAADVAVTVFGPTQAGIARPTAPQSFGLLSVGDLARPEDLAFLPELGRQIARLVTAAPAALLPDGPSGLTVTVGVGPHVVSARNPALPGAQPLPDFPGDDHIDAEATGGDLLLAAYANDPNVLAPVLDYLVGQIPGFRQRWRQRGIRGPGDGTIVRNPLGFHDGVTVPRTDQELAENVWLDGELAGGTICVVRRLRLDGDAFHALSITDRQQVFGRTLDGAPLSGGAPFSNVNLEAKAPDGSYLIPARAHVRAAHPSFTGSHLMLRRGYGYDNGGTDAGLLFVCFQRELRTFVATQHRLHQLDHLMQYVRPTASGTFLILPGFTAEQPLGLALR